ncbi:MAG: carbamoyltransferase HypF [bacterium]|nr:carbamoyltransferase HypF [bacterium]
MSTKRFRITINGIVQGVGFRPFVYRLAERYSVCGFVKNTLDGVLIEAQGKPSNIESFISCIKKYPPPRAKIKKIVVKPIPLLKEDKFSILRSNGYFENVSEIPPDIATCRKCFNEIIDSKNRRYLYPFTNCVDCGPRFTIVQNLPYDRENTSMNKFKMCPECEREYNNPLDRRFHAQTNCCEICGPRFFLTDVSGNEVCRGILAIKKAVELISEGKIIAMKGIGGFHLACDAFLTNTVKKLRERKKREEKPFALMARDIKTAEKYCVISEIEKQFLISPNAPIVLLKKKKKTTIFEEIAPKNNYLGIMLPYSPVHYLIFLFGKKLELLVMTSGNYSEYPICTDNYQALKLLSKIADFFLLHDRDIISGCDDSVMRILSGNEIQMIRRSRGFAPESIRLPFVTKYNILGCGGNIKTTFSLACSDNLYMSQHIGDIDTPVTFENYVSTIKRYLDIFKIKPEVIAYDAHPEYASTIFALSQDFLGNSLKIPVYHHHAHVCSCMIENNLKSTSVIGIAFDGTGYGQDGTLWGSEFLICDYSRFTRIAHLRPVRLAGGEQAIKKIWRIAISYLMDTFGEKYDREQFKFLKYVDKEELLIVEKMIKNGLNSPYSSGLGRFFDAVSCLCGLRTQINYEGQAASELESTMLENASDTPYNFDILKQEGKFIIDHREIIREIVGDILKKVPAGRISHRFHLTILRIIYEICMLLRKETGICNVVLTGGSFQNVFLSVRTKRILEKNGFKVYTHRLIPPNDACISVGQCAVACFQVL